MVYEDPTGADQGVFTSALLSGERILWQGKPVKARFLPAGIGASCFGFVFLAFSLFWTAMAAWITWSVPADSGNTPPGFKYFFPLFGLPFIAVGSGLTFGPLVRATREWRRTLYAITDRRILVRGGAGAVTISTTELDRVTGVTVAGQDIGDVTFQLGAAAGPVFRGVERPLEVQQVFEQARRRILRDQGGSTDAKP